MAPAGHPLQSAGTAHQPCMPLLPASQSVAAHKSVAASSACVRVCLLKETDVSPVANKTYKACVRPAIFEIDHTGQGDFTSAEHHSLAGFGPSDGGTAVTQHQDM